MRALVLTILTTLAFAQHSVHAGDSSATISAFLKSYGSYTDLQKRTTNKQYSGFSYDGILSQKIVQQSETVSVTSNSIVGMTFGILHEDIDLDEKLNFVITPPTAITNPESGATNNSFKFSCTLGQTLMNPFVGISLEKEWMREPGDWLFQVKHGDDVIVEKQLTIHIIRK